ncbi:uncharacterized protein [Penaeus vannamei]|uniref:uncharacterized protein isoform X1 n=1 Tax=Penaeus vannamei TaxID=6689 RepID=UPI00387F65CB
MKLLGGVILIMLGQASEGWKVSLTDPEVDRRFSTWSQKADVLENFRSRLALHYSKLKDEERMQSVRVFEGSGNDDDEESGMRSDGFNEADDLDTCRTPDKDNPEKVVCNFTNIPQVPSRLPQSLYRRDGLTELYIYGSRKLGFRTLCLEELHFIDCRVADAIDYRSTGKCGAPLDSMQLSNSHVDAVLGNFNKIIVTNSVIGNLNVSLSLKSRYIYVNASDIITLRGMETPHYNFFWISKTRVGTALRGGIKLTSRFLRTRPSHVEVSSFESIEPGGIQVQSGKLAMSNVTIGHLGEGGVEIRGPAEVRMVQVKIQNSSFEGISLEGPSAVLYMQDLELDGVVLSARFASTSSEPFVFYPMRLFLRQARLFDTAVTAVLCALAFAFGVIVGALVTSCCCLRKKGTAKINITEPPQKRVQNVDDTTGRGGRGGATASRDIAAFQSSRALRAEAELEPVYGNIRQPLCQPRGREPFTKDTNETPLYQDTSNEALYQDTSREPFVSGTSGKQLYQDTGAEPLYQDTSSEPIYQDTGREPLYQDTSSEPVYQDIGIEPLYQDTSTELGFQNKAKEPLYQGTHRTQISQGAGRKPTYQGAGRTPTYQGAGRTPTYQGAGRTPTYQGAGRTPTYQGAGGVVKTYPETSGQQDGPPDEEPLYGNVEQDPIYGNLGTDTHSGRCEDNGDEAIYANFGVDEEIYANI